MTVWRITRSRHAPSGSAAYNGEGATYVGGRWHSRGTRVAYASESLALAAFEILVHITWAQTASDYVFVAATIPDDAIATLDALPSDWNTEPHGAETPLIGDAFVRTGAHAALLVPSVVVPDSHNILINPLHPRFAEIAFETPRPFIFDPRLADRIR